MAQDLPQEETVDQDGYQLTFYPGFASRMTVIEADGTVRELYRQQRPFHLPPGHTLPSRHHRIRLAGHGQDLTVSIHDPELRVARIVVELYDEPKEARAPGAPAPKTTIDALNDGKLCPPSCE